MFFEFLVLPQGLTTSPYIFSRFTLAITNYLRRTLTQVAFLTYLDDLGWAIPPGTSLEKCAEINETIRMTFLNSGWVLSQKKSIFDPSCSTFILLGITVILSPKVMVDLPEVRKEKIITLLEKMILSGTTTPREYFVVGGSLQSAEIVLGPSITMFFRYIYSSVTQALGGDSTAIHLWDKPLKITIDCLGELKHWLHILKRAICRNYHRAPWVIRLDQITWQCWVDASGSGLGSLARLFLSDSLDPTIEFPGWMKKGTKVEPGRLALLYGQHVACQLLTEIQQFDSSTLRETRGLVAATIIHAEEWRDRSVQIFVDNAALERIAIRGSSIEEIHTLIRSWVTLCMEYNIRIQVIWIPRSLNVAADIMSRQFLTVRFDTEDYCLSHKAYQQICLYFNFQPSIDLFANIENTKCDKFYSRYAAVGTAGIDAFYQEQWGLNFYAFPPVDDAGLFLKQFLNPSLQGQHPLRGILILPLWRRLESTRIILDGNHFIPQVRAWYGLGRDSFTLGDVGSASFLNDNRGGHRIPFVAVLLDNSLSLPILPARRRFCLKKHLNDLHDPCTTCPHP